MGPPPRRQRLSLQIVALLAACLAIASAPVASGASCTSRCDSCTVKETGYLNGVSSSDCRKCARGYEFWPCNTPEAKRHCECVKEDKPADDGGDDDDNGGEAAAEASATPASPSVVSAQPSTAASVASPATTADNAELVQDLKTSIGGAPAAETREAAAGGAHRCSKCPGACVAASGAQRHGITDAACAKCASGYKWWPCQESGKCRCADASSDRKDEEGDDNAMAPTPTVMVASLPMSPALVAALDCPSGEVPDSSGMACVCAATGAARSTTGDCQCPEGQVLSADSFACQEAAEATLGVTYAAVSDWDACGGIAYCDVDRACAPCASANYECVSPDGNAWYWQCQQIPGTVDLTCGSNQEPNVEGTACVCLAAGAIANAATGGCDCPAGQALDAAGTACVIQSAEETDQVEVSLTSQANATLPSEIDLPCTQNVRQIITKQDWEDLFPYRNDPACKSSKKSDGTSIEGGFYEYEAFVEAAELFPCFLGQGDQATREREAAAFLAQISHETTGGWSTAPGGAQSWGLCWKEEVGCEQGQCAQYCAAGDPCTAAGENLPCVCTSGKTYHGRGPMQLSWNYNYAPASEAMRALDPRWSDLDLLENPDRITEDPVLAFATGIHFWQNPRGDKPSAHDVMTNQWQPSEQDISAGRVPGFGVTTNIINGGLECNIPNDYRVEDRVQYYKRYAEIFGVPPGDDATLRCDTQIAYG